MSEFQRISRIDAFVQKSRPFFSRFGISTTEIWAIALFGTCWASSTGATLEKQPHRSHPKPFQTAPLQPAVG